MKTKTCETCGEDFEGKANQKHCHGCSYLNLLQRTEKRNEAKNTKREPSVKYRTRTLSNGLEILDNVFGKEISS